MPSPLAATITELQSTLDRRDVEAFGPVLQRLVAEGRGLRPDQLSEAIGELAPILAHKPSGAFVRLAVVAGAFVEWGGSPLPLVANVPACTILTLDMRAVFSEAWPLLRPGQPEPEPDQAPPTAELVDLFSANAAGLGLTADQALFVATSLHDAEDWVRLMLTLLARRDFRDAADLLDLAEVADRVADRVPGARWLSGLAQVLDDEPVVAIHRATRRGYRLTMSGIGDNMQLHTLLADRLIGDPDRGMLTGEPPEPGWVTAATTGPPLLPVTAPIERRFRLFDARGSYVYPEGRPADIPVLDGARVVVLHPALSKFAWTTGRIYEHMEPALALDGMLTPAEVRTWLARIAPARATDMAARTGRS